MNSSVFSCKKGATSGQILQFIFQLLMVITVVFVLFSYVNGVSTNLDFEKRFASIDLALVTTAVFYAPGTMKLVHQPIPFKVPVSAAFADSKVSIIETGTDVPPVVYWHLSDFNMDVFRGSVSLKGSPVDDSEDYVPPNITFYKSGRQVSFSESDIHPFQIPCPSLNTTVDEWRSEKIFIAKVFADGSAYKDTTRAENRIATILASKHPDQIFLDMAQTTTGSKISGIPAEADIVIALGDSGEQREAGSLVAYIPVNDNVLKARKLACLMINNLLVPASVVFYAQIMPVFVDNLDEGSGLRVFGELSADDQVMVFLDISKFSAGQADVNAISDVLFRAVEQYYGSYDIAAVPGSPLSFTTTQASPVSGLQSIEEALDAVVPSDTLQGDTDEAGR